jgi:8-oxo-dGTP diphosphatase
MGFKKPWWLIRRSLATYVASANVIVENTNGELLVLKAHYKAYWSLPGGLIDDGETPRGAAIRECQEETGLEFVAEELELAAIVTRDTSLGNSYLFVFRLNRQIDPSTPMQLEPAEIDDYAWVTKQDVRTKKDDKSYNTAVKNWAAENPLDYIERVV